MASALHPLYTAKSKVTLVPTAGKGESQQFHGEANQRGPRMEAENLGSLRQCDQKGR